MICLTAAQVDSRITAMATSASLNLDRPYAYHVFTVVIWGEYRSKFDKPEVTYRDQLICVTGKISSYRSIPA